MSVTLTDQERKNLARVVRRPAKLRYYYQARILLELARGRAIDEVARRYDMNLDSVTRLAGRSGEFAANARKMVRSRTRSNRSKKKFEADLAYVLEKNRSLYKRLAE
jgi:hypothetical protein